MSNDLYAKLLPILAPLFLEVWSQAIYPELQKLETQFAGGNATLDLIGKEVEAAIDRIVKAEVAKLTAPATA